MKKSFNFAALGAMVLALSACGGGSDDGSGSGDSADVPLAQAPAVVQKFAAEFNAARAVARNCGAQAMPAVHSLTQWNSKLQAAAQGHADDMNAKGYFSHTRQDGKTLASYGYELPAGENIARGTTNPSALTALWLNSPGHCNPIMAGTVNTVAAAQSGPYTVVLFGQ